MKKFMSKYVKNMDFTNRLHVELISCSNMGNFFKKSTFKLKNEYIFL